MVVRGGSGGIKAGGGGGAGGLIFRQNETLNGNYIIRVGNGGNAIVYIRRSVPTQPQVIGDTNQETFLLQII